MARKLEMQEALGGAVKVMERQEEPVMIHGLPAYSFVVATFSREEDALLFISAALPGTEQGMSAEYKRWVMQEGLEHIDAEELFHEVAAEETLTNGRTAEQSRRMNWLQDFIARWEGASRKQGEAFYNAPVEDKAPLTLQQYEALAVEVMEAKYAKDGASFATPEWMESMRDCPLAEPEFYQWELIISHGQKIEDGEVVWANEDDIASAYRNVEKEA